MHAKFATDLIHPNFFQISRLKEEVSDHIQRKCRVHKEVDIQGSKLMRIMTADKLDSREDTAKRASLLLTIKKDQ